jgi:hypothetical protein
MRELSVIDSNVADTLRCANCNGKHSSAYKKCPEYQDRQEAIKVQITEGVSFKNALHTIRLHKHQDSNVNSPGLTPSLFDNEQDRQFHFPSMTKRNDVSTTQDIQNDPSNSTIKNGTMNENVRALDSQVNSFAHAVLKQSTSRTTEDNFLPLARANHQNCQDANEDVSRGMLVCGHLPTIPSGAQSVTACDAASASVSSNPKSVQITLHSNRFAATKELSVPTRTQTVTARHHNNPEQREVIDRNITESPISSTVYEMCAFLINSSISTLKQVTAFLPILCPGLHNSLLENYVREITAQSESFLEGLRKLQ